MYSQLETTDQRLYIHKNAYNYFDGCGIAAQTLPNGEAFPYNVGTVLVHEVGHWFGLIHPFERGQCEHDSDGIPDTPFQSTNSAEPSVFEPPDFFRFYLKTVAQVRILETRLLSSSLLIPFCI
jgi:Pregnancy-associated plasma protein-A